METFTNPKPFTSHPGYVSDREKTLRELEKEILNGAIDPPLLPMIRGCMTIPYFFTVQCCFGHFVHDLEKDPENLISPARYKETIKIVRYRIAYVTICIQNNIQGREMFSDLEKLAADNPDYIQFGSADWFWERMVNTYCIQLEPIRFKGEDTGMIGMREVLHIEMLRTDFFERITEIILKPRIGQ